MERDIKLSIVTSYYNRKDLFKKTLTSIQASKSKDKIEVIVVDDASSENQRIEDLADSYDFPIKVIRVEPEEKTYINPCVPYNRGFKAAEGELIMIQNPECYHVGDVITHALKETTSEKYLAFSTYALSKEDTEKLGTGKINLLSKASTGGQAEGWYNHSTYNPRPLHFASCITKNNLEELGGFDESYAQGVGFDDDDLLFRIQQKGLEVHIVDSPFILHQNHYDSDSFEDQASVDPQLLQKNQMLYITRRKEAFAPKIFGFAQLHNELEKGNLENWFKSMQICDQIFIFDQNSTDGSREYYKRFNNVHVIESDENRFSEEMVCKQELLDKALSYKEKADWIFWMDGDTVLDARVNRENLEHMLFDCELQNIDGIALGHYNLWRSDKYHRVDSEYDHFLKVGCLALWKNTGQLQFDTGEGLHKPQFPMGMRSIVRAPFNLIHKGFSDDDQIIGKYNNYKSRGQSGWALERLLCEKDLQVEEVPKEEIPSWLEVDERNPKNKKPIKEIYEEKY